MTEPIATGHFTARVVREYSATPRVDDLGVQENTVRLYAYNGGHYFVEWDAGDLETVGIGIWVDHNKKITDYDGVFSLPREIGKFLRDQGFDTSEVNR